MFFYNPLKYSETKEIKIVKKFLSNYLSLISVYIKILMDIAPVFLENNL